MASTQCEFIMGVCSDLFGSDLCVVYTLMFTIGEDRLQSELFLQLFCSLHLAEYSTIEDTLHIQDSIRE